MNNYILYKESTSVDILLVLEFLRKKGFKIEPRLIHEKMIPNFIIILPSIMDVTTNSIYPGFKECLKFYILKTGLNAEKFHTEFSTFSMIFQITTFGRNGNFDR